MLDPRERLYSDFTGPVQVKMFLFIENAFAKWLQVCTMPKLTAAETTLIGSLAIQETSLTDNGAIGELKTFGG